MEVKPVKRRHPFDFLGVILAILIMFLPVEADIMHSLCRRQMYVHAAIFYLVCLSVVGTPFTLARLRCRREPGKWQDLNWCSIITGSLLVLNVLSGIVVTTNRFWK